MKTSLVLLMALVSLSAWAEDLAGHYVLKDVMEVGSELLLKPGSHFEYMLAYGGADYWAKGTGGMKRSRGSPTGPSRPKARAIQKVLALPHWQGKLAPCDYAAPTEENRLDGLAQFGKGLVGWVLQVLLAARWNAISAVICVNPSGNIGSCTAHNISQCVLI
jgi:hypothetical protein